MTPKQTTAFGKQLNTIARALGIYGWDICLADQPTEEGVLASIDVTYGRRYATISLCAHWDHLSASERHHTLIHELLHIVTDPMRTYLGETLPVLLGQPAYVAVSQAIHQHEEQAVDQLATALAPFIPVMEDPR